MTGTALLVVELVLLFLGVSFAVEIVQRRFGPDRIRTWMGGRPVVAALKGITVGFVTPFCTYSAIPMLVGLRRAGVPPAGYVAFIAAAPVLDPILLGALVLIAGPTIAASYVVVTFTAALLLALGAQWLHVERHLRPVDDTALSGSCTTAGPRVWEGWRTESVAAARSSLRLVRAFGPLVLAGVALGIAIEHVVAPDAAARVTTGSPFTSIPIASALATPLYFNTELFVPIADSLAGAGVGIGAIVALTIAGAGANLPEFVVLTRMAPARVVGTFFAYVFAVAIGGGFIAHALAAGPA